MEEALNDFSSDLEEKEQTIQKYERQQVNIDRTIQEKDALIDEKDLKIKDLES